MSGTPRKNSMNVAANQRTGAVCERRISASSAPSTRAITMAPAAARSVFDRPPEQELPRSTSGERLPPLPVELSAVVEAARDGAADEHEALTRATRRAADRLVADAAPGRIGAPRSVPSCVCQRGAPVARRSSADRHSAVERLDQRRRTGP